MQREESGGEERGWMSPNVRRVRALGDRALIDAMRGGDDWAFGEFLARFRPAMLAYAQGRIPDALFPECVDDVLEDAAIELADPRSIVPTQLRAYLVGAVRRRHLAVHRSGTRRRRWYEEAARAALCTNDGFEAVVPTLCAESTIAASRGADIPEANEPTAIERLALAMEHELDDETRQILAWMGQSVPHRQIAAWLGRSYEATTKRIWRLCRRLERAAPAYAATMPPSAQRELERFFRRAQRGRRPA
jgi:DNA-directed RNA polymerase specialized sigma24 family protein